MTEHVTHLPIEEAINDLNILNIIKNEHITQKDLDTLKSKMQPVWDMIYEITSPEDVDHVLGVIDSLLEKINLESQKAYTEMNSIEASLPKNPTFLQNVMRIIPLFKNRNGEGEAIDKPMPPEEQRTMVNRYQTVRNRYFALGAIESEISPLQNKLNTQTYDRERKNPPKNHTKIKTPVQTNPDITYPLDNIQRSPIIGLPLRTWTAFFDAMTGADTNIKNRNKR